MHMWEIPVFPWNLEFLYLIYFCSLAKMTSEHKEQGLLVSVISGRQLSKRKPNSSLEILLLFSCASACPIANYHSSLALQFHSTVISPSSIGGYHYSIHFAYTFTYAKCVLFRDQVAQIRRRESSKESEYYISADMASSVFTIAHLEILQS